MLTDDTMQRTRRPRFIAPTSALLTTMAVLLAAACAGEDERSYTAADILDQTPRGLIGGTEWVMVDAVVLGEDGVLDFTLLPVEALPCDSFTSADRKMIFSVSGVEGSYPLNLNFASLDTSQTVTFVTGPGENEIASEGIIVIESIHEATVTVGLVANAGSGNFINGRFDGSICGRGVPTDSGPGDAGPGDSEPSDSGPGDSGPSDSGPDDSGSPDAAPTDSGTSASGDAEFEEACTSNEDCASGICYSAASPLCTKPCESDGDCGSIYALCLDLVCSPF